jgi:RNA polymerase II subunit A small phosphatase-like protein
LGRDMKDVIIIDNSPAAYLFQPENALPILSWYDDKEDQVLYEYVSLLKELSNVEDVRPILSTSVSENVINIQKAKDLIRISK